MKFNFYRSLQKLKFLKVSFCRGHFCRVLYEDIYDEYFSIEEVQKQLHTLKNGKTIPYAGWNNTCYLNMKYDGIVDYTETYNMLVNAGVKTMVISGAMDGL